MSGSARKPMRKGIRELLAEANASVETLSAAAAKDLVGDDDVVFVDVREEQELRNGAVPGSVHASRGLLEFFLDVESPYHKPVFAADKRFVFYCAGGGRSALATARAREMGLERVAHVGGGFKAWREAGGPVEPAGD